jgi:hypothetical protein
MSTNFEFALDKDEKLNIGEHKWYGKDDRTEDESIHDKGKGEPVVVRLFEYNFPPTLEKLPTDEELLTPDYLREIDTQLWSDGLRRVQEPRTHVTKEGCKVFVPCVATTGNSHLEAPKLLQEYI